ncbi:MAG TPA: CBS domain-containing protein [Candidatus Saccharimonadales bacterium]|jgi:CBS domain containing-hemolysin-like protein
MFIFIIALLLIALALMTIALKKTYLQLPVKELKRRARAGDATAKTLYRAAAYGVSLQVCLWVIIVVAFAASFVLLDQVAPWPLAFVVTLVVIGYGFVWLPSGRVTDFGVSLAAWATPAVAWLLQYLHPLLDACVKFAQNHRIAAVHTRLYEREDLLVLLEQQKNQADSRFSAEELELLTHALTFGQKTTGEVMVPRREVRLVSEGDAIGPMLMQDLHASGHSRFPVYKDKEDNIVGTLHLRDLVSLKHTGHVRDIMESAVFYVHEEYPLEQVLHAFLKTKHHLFIVINKFEEFVGIIAIEDILEQILGAQIVDVFDAYDDIRAVAADHARHDHHKRIKDGEELRGTKTQESKSESQPVNGETPKA